MLTLVIVLSSLLAYLCIGMFTSGLINGRNRNSEWSDPDVVMGGVFWPISILVFLFLTFRITSLAYMGQRFSIAQRQRRVKRQENLHKVRVDLEQAERRLQQEAEAEVEQCLQEDKFTC
jgi:hypothetical protein